MIPSNHLKFLPAATSIDKAAAVATLIAVGFEFALLNNGVLLHSSQTDEHAFASRIFNPSAKHYTAEFLDLIAFGDAVRTAAANILNRSEKALLKTGTTQAIFIVATAVAARLDLVTIAKTVPALDSVDLIRVATIWSNVAARKRDRGIAEIEAELNNVVPLKGHPK